MYEYYTICEDMGKEEVKRAIIEFTSNHQYSTAEEIVQGLKDKHSRNPIFDAQRAKGKRGNKEQIKKPTRQ
jgi:hypothetical protein